MNIKNIDDVYKLTPRQRDLYVASDPAQLDHLVCVVRSQLDAASLDRAARDLSPRHPVLRTAFLAQGLAEPVQVVRQKADLAIERKAIASDRGTGGNGTDHTGDRDAALNAAIAEHVRAERRRGMNLSAAPLARLTLIEAGPRHAALVLGWHPLVLDEPAARFVLDELLATYEAFRSGAEPGRARSRPFRDHVAWIDRKDHQAEQRFWESLLRGAEPTRLPVAAAAGDQGAGAGGAHDAVEVQRLKLGADRSGELATILRQRRLDLATIVEAAWALLLADGERRDVMFGTAVSGRPAPSAPNEAMIGPLAGAIPRRVILPERGPAAAWLETLEAERERALAVQHATAPQIRSWAALGPTAPLFHTLVAVAPAAPHAEVARRRRLEADDPRLIPSPSPLPSLVVMAGPRLGLELRYDATLPFIAGQRLLEGVASLLTSLIDPGADLASLRAAAHEVIVRATVSPSIPPSVSPTVSAIAPPITGGADLAPAVLESLLGCLPWIRRARVRRADGDSHRLIADVNPDRGRMPLRADRRPVFSLFYFADADAGAGQGKYRLYLEGARFADRNGFHAVWTPERHFHSHGGLYPNPALLSAALAVATERVRLRSGSVVLPLQHPFRVAEDWAVVDNLSGGRVGISVASGWVPDDFVLAPESYPRRREVMFERLADVQRLWHGEALPARDGLGQERMTRIFPRPVQPTLPVWLTAAGNPETFREAGARNLNVLTALLYQSLDSATRHIAVYRRARAEAGLDPAAGHVTLMLHTYLARDAEEALDTVREPLQAYLRSHVSLMESLVHSMNLPIDVHDPRLAEQVAAFAFERYQRSSALIGSPTSCLSMIDQAITAGTDEIACLIDFGVPIDRVIESFEHILRLKQLVEDEVLLLSHLCYEHLAERLPGRVLPALEVRIEPPGA